MRVIRNFDVASYYPHLMTVNGYTSRNIPNPKVYADILERRIQAKKSGDKATANALKLVANTTYGGMLNRYNELYDPLMARSVCISGQLYLFELANHLYADVPDLKIVQLNTDGIMISFDDHYLPIVYSIINEWENRTGFELEEDKIVKIIQKDVNGYIEVQDNGEIKCKGGYLVRGIAPAGAFNVNNNMPIVSTAIIDYFTKGTPAAETINASTEMLDFQIIAKASGKYDYVFQIVNGEQIKVQKCNRVYASTDPTNGTLFKVHTETKSAAKIAGLPEHCLIDNANTHTLADIDRSWYIALAEKHISEFLGESQKRNPKQIKIERGMEDMAEEKKTPTKTAPNIYQRLCVIREQFASKAIAKTGKNPHAEFMYFTLNDIIPVARPIISENGCIFIITSTGDNAIGQLVTMDNPTETITFAFEGRPIAEPAKFRMNETQARGAEITYQRRYLYALMLDLCEEDEIENGTPVTPKEPEQPKKTTKPATSTERKEIVKDLTSDADADELMLKSLKTALSSLLKWEPNREPFVKEVAAKTQNFTKISRSACEELITKVNKILATHDDDMP